MTALLTIPLVATITTAESAVAIVATLTVIAVALLRLVAAPHRGGSDG